MNSTPDQLLRRADPVGRVPKVDARATADLFRILGTGPEPRTSASPAPARPPRWGAAPRPRLALAACLAVLLLAGGALQLGTVAGLVPGTRAAYAATPERLAELPDTEAAAAGLDLGQPARELLGVLADRAAASPDQTGSGPYARVQTTSWSLWSTVDGERVTSEVVAQATTSWAAADGSGRVRNTVVRPGRDRVNRDERVGPGGRAFQWPLGSLSSDPATLKGQLEAGHPVENGPAERLVAVLDATAEQPMSPKLRAAVLRYLADTPGLTVTGLVLDRQGRPGLAVHVDTDMTGLPERRTVVLDPNDGTVLAAETMLTEDAGALNVPVPSVISYTTFLGARYTPTTS